MVELSQHVEKISKGVLDFYPILYSLLSKMDIWTKRKGRDDRTVTK
jgi:hypothetical protein